MTLQKDSSGHYLDKDGKRISKAEAIALEEASTRKGKTKKAAPVEPVEEMTTILEEPEHPKEEPRTSWIPPSAAAAPTIPIDAGRGNMVDVPVHVPFAETIDRVAERANYGGYYRVYLNGSEISDPSMAPPTIEPGMRIALTAYDKVG
jgi:hypothetical protein